MTITKIQNPYKMPEMQSFSYNKPEQTANEDMKGVSKGLGIIAPPPPKPADTKEQDRLELTREINKNINSNIDKKKKTVAERDELKTPTGVKMIAGLVVLALTAFALKKAGVFAKIASLFKKAA